MRRIHYRIIISILVLAFSIAALAQTGTTGQVIGAVTDPSSAMVSGAKVELSGGAGVKRETTTNGAGEYIFSLVPAGNYVITVSSPNFRKAEVKNVVVRITETTRLNVPLALLSAAENVTVTAEAPLLQTTSPANGRVVDSETITELPLATRNFTQILTLSTGTATFLPDNTAVGRNSQNISVNGGRVTWNNFQINGVDANSMGTNSAPSLSIPAPETLEEFKVQTSMYDATFGRSAGGNVQAVTKSGTDSYHGSLYEYFRNDALNANDPILKFAGVKRPTLRRNVYGGTLGGPIAKDKLFFFGSYQGTREANAASRINSQSSNILIADGLTNDRSLATLTSIFGTRPGTFGPVGSAGNPISPIAVSLLNAKLPNGNYLIPTPNGSDPSCASLCRYSGATASVYHEEQFNGNIDYQVSANNHLSGKFFFMNAPQTLVLPSFLGGGPNVPGYGNFQQNNGRIIAISDTHVFSPRTVNEFRAGYNFLRVDAYPQEPVTDASVGINRSNAATQPGLGFIQIASAAGGIGFGTSATIDVKATSPSTTIYDALTLIRGNHNFRIGGEFRDNQNLYTLNFFTRGQIIFSNFNDFLTGRPLVTVFGSGDGNRHLKAEDYNFFVQDDWKIKKNLTLNLGLRYELDRPVTDTKGRIATFDPTLYQPTLLSPAGPPSTGYVIAGNFGTVPAGVAKAGNNSVLNSSDPNNFAPRIGFAYSPMSSDKMVVRGGYGIFYQRSSFQYITLNVIAPPTYVFGQSALFPSLANPFFAAPPVSAFPTLVPPVTLAGQFFDRNLRTPYIQQYNLGFQYQLAKNTMLDVGYVGSHGLDLFRAVPINGARLVPTGGSITNAVTNAVITTNLPTNAAARAPFQGTAVNNFFLNQTTAQSNYNSMQVSLNQRAFRGVQILASYTYSKSIDNASGQGGGSGTGGVLNPGAVGETVNVLGLPSDPRSNRGVSDFDRTHRLVVSYIAAIPAPKIANDNAIAKGFLAGWSLSGITTWMSGLPVDVVDNGAASLYGFNAGGTTLARPNLIGDPYSNVPAGYYFNPAAFQRPVLGANALIPSSGGTATTAATCGTALVVCTDFGTLGRNALRGPRQSNFDFSLIKNFSVTERAKVEFRTDFFNLFNHVNYANPLSDFNAVTGSGGGIDSLTGLIKPSVAGTPGTGPGSFGKIISASSNPRLVQFALKLKF
jgi:hypothetical protein